MQQRALARPRRTDDGDQFTLVDAQIDAGQGDDGRVAGVLFDHVDQLEDRRRRMRLAAGRGERRVRDDQSHDDGTSTRMPALMPEPLTWTMLLL